MDDKIFLKKYRVAGSEMEAVGENTKGAIAYEAYEINSEKKVVVELIPTGPLKDAERERLESEAGAAKKLQHANIATLYDFGVEDNQLVYVTEDIKGTLAEDWVNAQGPLPITTVLRIAMQVVNGLAAALFQQVVHKAINPANLVLAHGQTAEGEWPLVKILHFVGGAPPLSDTGGTVASFDKSLRYVSPEQIKDGTTDFRSEIYSLGCTMWFLLTGVPPLLAPNDSMPSAPVTARTKIKAVPKRFRRLLAQMLASDPDARPDNPLDLYRKLHDCLTRAERRESISRRFGLLPISRSDGEPIVLWRTPVRTLAMAAIFLALAALTALAVSGYIRHQRIVRSEEPIGVPIGVPTALPPVTPGSVESTSAVAANASPPTGNVVQANSPAKAPNAVTTSTTPVDITTQRPSIATETTSAVVQSNPPTSTTPSLPNETVTSNGVPPASGPAQNVEQNQVAAPPAPSSGANVPQLIPQDQPPAVAANNSAATSQSEIAIRDRTETNRPSTQSSKTDSHDSKSKTIAGHEVRRAKPAEPEVRRGEPAPPAEGIDSTPDGSVSSTLEGQASAESGAENISPATKHDEVKPKITSKSRSKSRRYAKPRQWRSETIYAPRPTDELDEPAPRMQRGNLRARFVGVTPEGMWIMRLPSGRVVLVPPPRGSYEDDND